MGVESFSGARSRGSPRHPHSLRVRGRDVRPSNDGQPCCADCGRQPNMRPHRRPATTGRSGASTSTPPRAPVALRASACARRKPSGASRSTAGRGSASSRIAAPAAVRAWPRAQPAPSGCARRARWRSSDPRPSRRPSYDGAPVTCAGSPATRQTAWPASSAGGSSTRSARRAAAHEGLPCAHRHVRSRC